MTDKTKQLVEAMARAMADMPAWPGWAVTYDTDEDDDEGRPTTLIEWLGGTHIGNTDGSEIIQRAATAALVPVIALLRHEAGEGVNALSQMADAIEASLAG